MMNNHNKISALNEVIKTLNVLEVHIHQLQYKGLNKWENENNKILIRKVKNNLNEQMELLK